MDIRRIDWIMINKVGQKIKSVIQYIQREVVTQTRNLLRPIAIIVEGKLQLTKINLL